MCLAIPARVVEFGADDSAVVDLAGVRKEISLALVDNITVGDYVIVHVGYALNKLDPEEAARTLALFAEIGEFDADTMVRGWNSSTNSVTAKLRRGWPGPSSAKRELIAAIISWSSAVAIRTPFHATASATCCRRM